MGAKEYNDVYGSVDLDYKTHEASATCRPVREMPLSDNDVEAYVKGLSTETDFINSPPHYTNGQIECIDYIQDALTEEEYRGYLRGCMIKYQHRLMHKDSPKKNAEKMRWYNDKLIEVL